jgi:hypothetical protein
LSIDAHGRRRRSVRTSVPWNSGLFSGAGHGRDTSASQQMLTELREIAESFAKIIVEFKK